MSTFKEFLTERRGQSYYIKPENKNDMKKLEQIAKKNKFPYEIDNEYFELLADANSLLTSDFKEEIKSKKIKVSDYTGAGIK